MIRVNIPRRHSNPKYVYNKQQSYKICKIKLIEIKGETDKFTITIRGFTFFQQSINETEN